MGILEYIPLEYEDIDKLVPLMCNAFDDDFRRLNKTKHEEPFGYPYLPYAAKFNLQFGIKDDSSAAYKITTENLCIGAFIIRQDDDEINILTSIFIDPAYQSYGVGKETWGVIEKNYPANLWQLKAPFWSTKCHNFYVKKCGFEMIATREYYNIFEKEYY